MEEQPLVKLGFPGNLWSVAVTGSECGPGLPAKAWRFCLWRLGEGWATFCAQRCVGKATDPDGLAEGKGEAQGHVIRHKYFSRHDTNFQGPLQTLHIGPEPGVPSPCRFGRMSWG